MRIISRKALVDFWAQPDFADAEEPLKAWYNEAKHATWQTPQDIKDKYGTASIVANNRVVFNIHGNKYRLVVAVKYEFSIIYIRFVGTHEEYDRIDVVTI